MFGLFTVLVCLVALWEYFHIVFKSSGRSVFSPLAITAFFTGPAIIAAAYYHAFQWITGLFVLNLLACSLITVFQYKSDPMAMDAVARQIQGVVYIPLLLAFLPLIRNGSDGIQWIFFLLLLVFACDTAAFYTGSYLGKHKLCPSVSPGKTIEGFSGGLAAVLVMGAAYKMFVLTTLPLTGTLVLALTIGMVGPLGDLFESVLKRTSGIKDSGSILPGHGGILDRIDALLFAAPVMYLFKEFFL